MIRTLTLAAAAALLVAAPASAQSMRVSVAGKSPTQLHADITKAAVKVCRSASLGASFPRELYADCYKATVEKTVAKLGDPALANIAGLKLAQR